MLEIIYTKGIRIESNRYYRAIENQFDYYLTDTVRSYNDEYRSHILECGDFLDIAFLLKDLENVVLDFNGATIVLHGRIQPFMLDNCKNVTIKNVKIDYDRPFYTQATVYDCHNGKMRIRMDEGFPCRVDEDHSLVAVSEFWENKIIDTADCLLWMYDPQDRNESEYPIILALFGDEIFPQQNPPLPVRQLYAMDDGEFITLSGDFPKEWECSDVGNKLLIAHEVRDKNTIHVVGGEGITLDHVQIIHGASMALTAMHTTNITVNRFDFISNDNGNGRVVTNNADAIHLFNCYGRIEIKNCTMEGILDDSINIHGNYLVASKIKNTCVWCRDNPAGLASALKPVMPGDKVAVFKGKTQELVDEFTIKDIREDSLFGGRNLYFEEEEALQKISAGDLIENLSANPEILVENCKFLRFRGTMRLQSRNQIIVRNCEFRNKGISIFFTGDASYWYESSPVRNCLIEKCYFGYATCWRINCETEVQYTDKEPYYHKGITVRECYFDGKRALRIDHADDVTFLNNSTSEDQLLVSLPNCGKRSIEGAFVIEE